MSLLSLPTELVLQISDSLEISELYSLLQCNRRLANILTSIFCNLALSDPNTLGKRAFQLAAKSSDIEMVKSLMAISLPTHILNGHHIGYICPSLTPTEINTLLSVDHFSVDARDTLGRTPLYCRGEQPGCSPLPPCPRR
ncbi:hypothetical protein L873DRAFT_1481629 [Choiromyces venosus 120613-1]|uniref:F-box domain-containing protein n=1 Tax=Choiromyces venosus 120613-1 TaxID=1336337 RepID=A0A3N4J719_9PEZI|nr:hypothetical protein L873DRAFT_1481629 [Choiromyces venosus 120613-1]